MSNIHKIKLNSSKKKKLKTKHCQFSFNLHRYFVYGMQDAQNLERVKLDFSIFDIPKGEHKPKSE